MNPENLCMGCMREKGEGVVKCLRCGYVDGSPYLPAYLAPRTVLQERYLVGKVLSYNGCGATYIAYDAIMNCKVKIREYMPENLASREKGSPAVRVNTGSEIQYKSLKMDFLELSQRLMKLGTLTEVEHVLGVFEANNTAYAVLEFVEGMTLTEFLKKNGGYLSWEDTRQLFMPLLSCLNAIHNCELLHRGISPETILVDRSGNLKLTSFDIAPARTARSELVAQLYAGYAAPEQYTSSAWQDTYTDVYAIAATIYRTLTGTMPVETLSRVANDNLVSASTLNQSIPKNVSNALTAAMQLSPEKRTQTVGELIAELSQVMDFGDGSENPQAEAPVVKEKEKDKKNGARYAAISVAISAPVLILIIVVLMLTLFPRKKPSNVSSKGLSSISVSSESSSSETSSKTRFLYAVPSFVSRNVDAIINDTDYTEKYKFKTVYDYNEEYAEGTVVEQSVEAGTPVESNGTEITLTVSRGSKWRVLPDLVGRNVDYAKDTLNDKFIRYEVETLTGTYGDPQVVAKMSKEEGTRLDISQGQTVILYVYEALPSSSSRSKPDTDWVNDLQ